MTAEKLRELIRQNPGIEFWREDEDDIFRPEDFENGDYVHGVVIANSEYVKSRIAGALKDFISDYFEVDFGPFREDFLYGEELEVRPSLVSALADGIFDAMGTVHQFVGPVFIVTQELFDVIVEETK